VALSKKQRKLKGSSLEDACAAAALMRALLALIEAVLDGGEGEEEAEAAEGEDGGWEDQDALCDARLRLVKGGCTGGAGRGGAGPPTGGRERRGPARHLLG
jgi:hypothetical protein